MSAETKQVKLVTYLLLKKQRQVFLVKYKDSPNPKRTGWWVPAPELEHGQHPEDAAKRILASVGVYDISPQLAGVDSFVTRDWHVLFYYTAEISSELKLDSRYELGEWFDVSQLPEAKTFAHAQWEKDLVVRLFEGRP